jgi:hypothetical protein
MGNCGTCLSPDIPYGPRNRETEYGEHYGNHFDIDLTVNFQLQHFALWKSAVHILNTDSRKGAMLQCLVRQGASKSA